MDLFSFDFLLAVVITIFFVYIAAPGFLGLAAGIILRVGAFLIQLLGGLLGGKK